MGLMASLSIEKKKMMMFTSNPPPRNSFLVLQKVGGLFCYKGKKNYDIQKKDDIYKHDDMRIFTSRKKRPSGSGSHLSKRNKITYQNQNDTIR